MTCGTTLHKKTLLAAASALALMIDGGDAAVAQTSHELPAVQVHAPTPRAARRVAPRQNAATAPRAAPRPVEPRARTTPPTGMIGSLPPSYAGGQVASGSQVGMLGNRNVMDTPFNQTSYTAQTIQDQQARKLDDVLANDPSIRSNVPRAYGFDFVSIRGFDVPSSAYGINGLYGIASAFSFSSLAAIERVEMLKGPGALLSGMPPGGGVGGSINLVTKRAGDDPIAQLTNTYASRSQFGTHFDVGRRFGEASEFGVRFNGSYRNGDTELANQSQELGTAALGLDYRGERVRLSADVGYEKNNVDAMTRFVVLGPTLTGVPVPPDARASFMPSWGYWNGEGKFGLVQGEVDITENLTAYAQAGVVKGETKYLYSDIRVTNLNGNFDGSPRLNSQTRDQAAVQAGFRASVDTGPIHHAINFNATGSEGDVGIINTTGTAFTSNLYSPRPSPTPLISVGAPPKISDTHLSSFGIADTMSVANGRVQFTAGVRQQYVESRSFSATTGLQTSGYDTSATTPAYAVVIKPLENVSIYANYIEGLEAGTVVGAQYANAGQVLPPYRTRQYEVGAKVDWGRITTTVSAFDINRPLQLVDFVTNTLTQSGESRNRGVELNVFGEVTPGVRLLGGVMFIDARQDKTERGQFDGYRTFGVPDTQLNLGGEWDVPFLHGLTLTGRAIYTGSFFVDQANTLLVSDWTRYDAGARYTFTAPWNNKPVVVRFQVENLFDKNYWQGANTNRYVYLGAPRTYLVSTTFNF
ncbi:TonB-dependent siderophore receptor [Bradyrhizobium sp. Leo121]|uniref:TonB-dependent receptor n=1 Tax=Bradyrhizobium sp. Leo121 TaxID=1571195 RepID=UPI0010293018|nr:TonB-dependent siderophore receptor [Bradyrhizobium sp. Leo121]RZN18818.1 TonB-dependent siderophore receptor [Bradyrhizobium sp. Leo121]